MTTRAVIFDCDGVLVDSARETLAHCEDVCREVGREPLTPAEIEAALSLSGPALFEQLFRGDDARRDHAFRVAQAIPTTRYAHLIRPADGVHGIVDGLRARFRLGVASNRGPSLAVVLQRAGIGDRFHAIANAGEVARPKPHPDVLLLCLTRLGVAAHEAIYVGDTAVDRDAARAARVAFVGVGAGVTHERWIASLADLPSVLNVT